MLGEGAERMETENKRMTWIDAHIHLDKYEPDEREPLLQAAFAAGTEAVVAVSMDLASCEANRALAAAHPGRIMPAYGYHPEQPVPSEAEEAALFAWIRERHAAGEAFAIGEVGLPYYTRSEVEAGGGRFDEAPYLGLLDRFAALAAELDRPIVLHTVYEDAEKACEIMERHGVRRAHFHWFKGPEAAIARMIALGYYVSITPDVTYEPEIQELARHYPIELLMAETDGPWPHEGPYAGQQTSPAMAGDAVRQIAAIKGLDTADAAARLLANTRTFYGMG
jgi:TatD DNase family protein